MQNLSIDEITGYLPHREPFLFVDSIDQIQFGLEHSFENCVGIKVVGRKRFDNEDFFRGHFPGHPITPGVILIETMAQIASFSFFPFIHEGIKSKRSKIMIHLVSVDETKFRKMVLPGMEVVVESELVKKKGTFFQWNCVASSEGQRVAESVIKGSLTVQNL